MFFCWLVFRRRIASREEKQNAETNLCADRLVIAPCLFHPIPCHRTFLFHANERWRIVERDKRQTNYFGSIKRTHVTRKVLFTVCVCCCDYAPQRAFSFILMLFWRLLLLVGVPPKGTYIVLEPLTRSYHFLRGERPLSSCARIHT